MASDHHFEPTPRTVPTRKRERTSYDRDAVYAVLDEALSCHVGYVVDGEPVVVPTIHARRDDVLYLHSSSGARLARLAAGDGVPVSVVVTLLDALVLARSQFNHSMNYRSVAVHGRAVRVSDAAELDAALAAVVEHVAAGRSAGSRPGTPKELAQTAVLRLPLAECVLKERAGQVGDGESDLALPHWAGLVPVRTVFGTPQPAPGLEDRELPDHIAHLGRPGNLGDSPGAGAAFPP
jgi:nitroimidazol reductase NimA-like FMN-containing flavoprotein (pyridoxamine 5'-phosphate oxidase superfamily)